MESFWSWVAVATFFGGPVGYVQGTIAGRTGWIAYLLGTSYRGRGDATEAMRAAMTEMASINPIDGFRATAEVADRASIAVLDRLGFAIERAADADGVERSATERVYVRRVA